MCVTPDLFKSKPALWAWALSPWELNRPSRSRDLWWHVAPTCRLLIGTGKRQHLDIAAEGSNKLQTERQPVPIYTAWHTDRGQAIVVGEKSVIGGHCQRTTSARIINCWRRRS